MGSSAEKATPVRRSWGDFLCAPVETSSPTILHRGAWGRSGVASAPPASGRKWSLCARGAALRVLSSFFFSPESGVLFGSRGGAGAPGGEGSSLVTLPCLYGLFINCWPQGRTRPPEGTPRSPGVGSAWVPGSLAGPPGKSPLPPFRAPQTQSGRRKRGERAFVNSNVRRLTPGGAFVNNLPFSVVRARGCPPPPCKSVAFQEAFEARTGVSVVLFLLQFFFSHFLRAAPSRLS